MRASHGAALDAATQVVDKLERQEATTEVEQAILEHYASAAPEGAGEEALVVARERRAAAQLAFDKLEKAIIRERIAVHKKRPDGRAEDEIRDITIEVGVTPRTHGSALFTRGQTQALSAAALGTLKEEMRLDTLGLQTKKYYFHHYNFPPFSVGEAGRLGPKRRDIGHGALAERALVPVIPSIEEFPYTIRVVSDIFESNGSSSMASVCGSSLSLMDAGVPIKRPVAGIAMGLIKEGDDYIVLTDIAGVEDHLGDMDFKVAGTEQGITALQMDIKISGVTFEILRDALTQAHKARTFILGKMAEVIDGPREQLSRYAPRIQTIQIDPSQIGLLIGKGGETIRGLSEEFESQIDVNDEGQVLIYSANGTLGDALVERIRTMMKEVEVGDEFAGKVVKTTTFGAFVELAKGTDGLLHISNVSPGQRVDTVEDVLNKGDEINVRVVEVDRERGRIGLRLAEDPEVAGKSVEELASVGTGGGGGGGGRPPRRVPHATAVKVAAAVTGTRSGGDRGSGRPRHGGRDRDRDRLTAGPLAASLCAGGRDPDPPERPTLSYEVSEHRITTLDCGVRVVSEPMPAVRSVALGFWIGTGSAMESDDQAGLSHLLEHMLFRGSERYGSEEIDQIFDAMGAECNAGTDKEATSVYTRVLDGHLERALDVMGEMIWKPRFEDLAAEREVVLEEIAMYEDDPQDRVFDVLGEAVFGKHPMGRPVIGRAEVVGALTRDGCAPFIAERYCPPQIVVISAAGSVDHDALVELVERCRRASRATPGALARASHPGIVRARTTRAGGRRGRSGGAPRGRRASVRAARALPAQGHRAIPCLPRRLGHLPPRRAPLRPARARRGARRDVLVTPFPGGARAPRARLLGVLVLEPVRAHGRGRAVRRHAPREPRARQ